MEVKSGRMFEKEILPFMEERIMKKLRTYNIYSVKEYEDIRKAVRYSIRFCKKLIRRLKMEEKKIDWEQRRYELAKAAMQALISNSFFMKNLGMYLDEHPDKKMDAIEVVAIESINYTDVLIKKLKGE